MACGMTTPGDSRHCILVSNQKLRHNHYRTECSESACQYIGCRDGEIEKPRWSPTATTEALWPSAATREALACHR